jgi:hypothetical protein
VRCSIMRRRSKAALRRDVVLRQEHRSNHVAIDLRLQNDRDEELR